MFGFGLIGAPAAEIRRDVAAAQSRDPGRPRVGALEILRAWPGVQALLAHRVAHALHGGRRAGRSRALIATWRGR